MVETLAHGVPVHTSPDHPIGSDTLQLARFLRLRPDARLCDLGTGCGILPLLLIDGGHTGPIDAVEIQPDAIALLERSVALGEIRGLRPLQADLRKLAGILPAGAYDAVCCNPPYYPVGTGRLSPSASRTAARHESDCTFEDICTAAARLLRFSGRFFCCAPPARLFELADTLRRHRLEPKRMQLVQHRTDKTPYLLLLESRLGGKPGLTVQPTLIQEAER